MSEDAVVETDEILLVQEALQRNMEEFISICEKSPYIMKLYQEHGSYVGVIIMRDNKYSLTFKLEPGPLKVEVVE